MVMGMNYTRVHGWFITLEVCIGTILWTAFYKLSLRYFRDKKAEWSSRVITLVHAVMMIALSAWATFVVGPFPIGYSSLLKNGDFHNHILAVSLSYFIFDTIWCFYYKTEGPTMLCHHVASVFTMLLLLTLQECVVSSVAALGLGEITNPLLQIRWFLKELKVKNTTIPLLVDIAFAVLFFVCRFVFIAYLSFYLLIDSRVRLIMKSLNVALMGISIIFMYQIYRAAVKTLKRHQKA